MSERASAAPNRTCIHRRGRRRAIVALSALLTLSVIAVPTVEAGVGDNASVGEAVPSSDPVLQESLEVSRPEENVGADAEASRLAYRAQSAAEALQTGQAVYPELLLAPAWRPMTLIGGSEVESYLGPHTARVDLPGDGGDAIVESTLPLRAPSESGDLEPVDLALVEQGPVIAPKNPLVPLRIEAELGGGAALPRAGVGFKPTGFDQNAAGRIVEDKAFYANAYRDTDYILRALPDGVEALFQLRSIDSPDRFALRFDFPAGAVLEHRGRRGVAVVKGDAVLAQITAPVAWDADGREVPVSVEVSGDELRLALDHASGNWTYPILLDPSVLEDYRYWSNGSAPDHTGWDSAIRAASGFVNAFGNLNYNWWGRGLYTTGAGWRYYDFWDWGTWYFDSPGDESFVFKGEFSNIAFYPGEGPAMAATAGIRTREGWWEPGVVAYTGQASPVTYQDYEVAYQTTHHCLRGDCLPAGTPNNQMALHTYARCACYVAYGNRTYMGGAAVWLADHTPAVELDLDSDPLTEQNHHTWDNGKPGLPPKKWIDSSALTVITEGSDRGLGVKKFRVSAPGIGGERSDGSTIDELLREHECAGDRHDRCENSGEWVRSDDAAVAEENPIDPDGEPVNHGQPFTYNTHTMAEGPLTVSAQVADFMDNWSTPETWQLNIDHTPPTVELEGSLADRDGETLDHGVYRLEPVVNDPYSGVKRIEVLVGDEERSEYVHEEPCDDTLKNQCPNTLRKTYEFVTATHPPGEYKIVVEVTDGADHKTRSDPITVRTDIGADCQGVFVDRDGSDPTSVDSCPEPPTNPSSFEGLCSVGGEYSRQFSDMGWGGTLFITARGTGTCSGRLDGQPVIDAPVTLLLTNSGNCHFVGLPDTYWSGPASLTFTNGTGDPADDAAFSLTFTLAGSHSHVLRLQENHGGSGSAVGHLTLPDHWAGCSAASSTFRSEFQTQSPLTG